MTQFFWILLKQSIDYSFLIDFNEHILTKQYPTNLKQGQWKLGVD